jgi:3-deoxy-manno-octulosonate cytidylyltransferase (CMP-KDO synthetase)
MKSVVIIPARYASSRFPGKPLVDIRGKSLIRRTWERCRLVLADTDIFVATDDSRIAEHCVENGMQHIMTSSDCLTGTDRVKEASDQIDADIYLDVQGDEPLINPDDITAIMIVAENSPGAVINGMCKIEDEAEFRSPMIPKVLAAPDGRLLYMSRAPVPSNKSNEFRGAMRQVCVMAFDKNALDAFSSVKEKTPLEAIEDLEVLRFLEMGFDVKMVEVTSQSIAVDSPEDVIKVEAVLAQLENNE